MVNFDRYLSYCEDRYADRIRREDVRLLQDVIFADEYGRSPTHPDYGFLGGPSVSVCPACNWVGDPVGSEFCPECHEEVEAQF